MLLREAQLQKAEEEREKARKLLEDRAAACTAEERKKRELFESLAREYGAASGFVIHTTVRGHTSFRAPLTMLTPNSQPCASCANSNEVCQGIEGKACNICSDKHAPCTLSGRSLLLITLKLIFISSQALNVLALAQYPSRSSPPSG